MAWKHPATTILLASAVFAFAATPEFEVASIKPAVFKGSGIARPGPARPMMEYTADGLNATNTLRALIAEAYQVPRSRVVEPSEDYKKILDRLYEVEAKSEHPASKADVRLMLRTLLAQRFQLSLHAEQKPEDVYRLVARKGTGKIEKSGASVEHPHGERRLEGLFYADSSAAKFCEILSAYFEKKVLASPDFEGLYNFPLAARASTTDEGRDAIIDTLHSVGIDLVKERGAIDYLVVDRVSSVSEN